MSTKRIFSIQLENRSIIIPEEVIKAFNLKEGTLKMVLSNDCFIVLKEEVLNNYLKK